ncbi:unnamed protein product, partial [Discosporangium mesarthrocarpum]
RFKDGSIVEAVVWKGQQGSSRHFIVEEVARHVLARHDPVRCGGTEGRQRVRYCGNQLLQLVTVGGDQGNGKVLDDDDSLTRSAVMALDKLQEMIKSLEGVPLRVESLQACTPLLRYTSLLPPCPHPLAFSPQAIGDSPHPPRKDYEGKISTQVEAIEVLLRMEGSGRWPQELGAVRDTNTAFLIRIAQCLRKQHKLRCIVGRDCLDVVTGGYCFRLRVTGQREIDGLKRLNPKPAFGLTVRVAYRWLEAHMLDGHIRQEALELLVASLFSASTPGALSAPASPLSGFLRFLVLLSSHDWSGSPLVVDPQGELSAKDLEDAFSAFERMRDRAPDGGPAMYLVAPYARDSDWAPYWTYGRVPMPEKAVLGRVVALALASSTSLIGWLSGRVGGWQTVFRLSPEEHRGFDVRLLLNPALVKDPKLLLDGEETFFARRIKGCSAMRMKPYKNLNWKSNQNIESGKGNNHADIEDESALSSTLLFGFDPVGGFVKELRMRFGHLAVFFSPGEAGGQGEVGLVWRPSAFLPRPLSVMHARHCVLVGGEANKVKGEGGKGGGVLMVPAVSEVLGEILEMGGDLITRIHLCGQGVN